MRTTKRPTVKTSIKKATKRSRAKPRTIITVTVEGGDMSVKCNFFPAVKVDGPIHPAHAVGASILKLISENADAL